MAGGRLTADMSAIGKGRTFSVGGVRRGSGVSGAAR